nr:retrovirus-related Pol polyprotein from transposon TNT 1-94 [Tanacetum cinerariifolium]
MSCLPDDIMKLVISCETTKSTWTDLVHSFECPSYTKESRIIDLKLEYQTFRAKPTESFSQTYTRYNTLLNELANDGVNLSKHETNVGFVNSLLEKWLTFSQGLRNANHTQTLDLEKVSDDEEVTKVKVLMALADDELSVEKNHAHNDWVERLNPDSKLSNFNIRRIIVPESQAVNESVKPTEASTDPESSKDSEAESLTFLPPLKILQGASASSEVMPLTFQPHSPTERPGLECSSCGALYTTDYRCSEGSLGDKIICDLDKTPDLSQRSPQNCPKCGNPVDGHYCQGCALLRKKFKEDLFTSCIENGILQDSSEPSNDNTNVVNALQEPFVVNQDPGKNSSQSPSQINHNCCYECGNPLEDIFCHQCTCKLCGNDAHYGYNCPPNVPIIPDHEPFNNQTIDEFPQTLPSFDSTYYSEDGNSFTYDSTSNLVHDSPNVFDPPPQLSLYSCEFWGNDARYGHYCTPQVPFIYPKPCYNQDFDFPQDFHNFQQQYLCCENYGVTHEAYQC